MNAKLFVAVFVYFLCSIFTFLLFAQLPTKQWDLRYGGSKNDDLNSLAATSDGGYILGGTSTSGHNGNKSQATQGKEDYWIVKSKSNGAKIWDKDFGGSLSDYLIVAKQATGGGYILGGYSYSGVSGDKTQASQGGTDYWIVKTDANGIKQWDKRFGGTSDEKLTSLLLTSDGGYLLGGYSLSGISGDKSQASQGANDFWIVKIDANGNKQWDKDFGGSDDDVLNSMVLTADGGYILAGYSVSGISGDKSQVSQGANDFWIVKIDASGTKQWDKDFGGSNDDVLEAIRQTADGGYLLGGNSNSTISGDKTQSSQGGYDYWIVKTDDNGAKQWDARFGGDGNDLIKDIVLTTDGRYLLAGSSSSQLGGDKTQDRRLNFTTGFDYWIVKVDSGGGKQWDLRYGGYGICNAALQISDGGFLLGGFASADFAFADITKNGFGGDDFWIVKVDAGGLGNYIVPGTIMPLSYHPGDTITFPFEGSGTFSANNIFTAQLSDTTGSFSSPATISSLASTTFGYISGIIPQSTPYGSNYRVRVISTDPSANSLDNGVNISINFFKAVSKQWDKTFGTSTWDYIGDAIETTEGGFIAGGICYSGISGDKTQASKGGADMWIIKMDANGNTLWDLDIGGTSGDYLATILQTNDKGYLFGGTSYSGIGGDKSEASQGSGDFWIVKTDSNGVKQWDHRFGGSLVDNFVEMHQTSDNGFILGGYSESPASGDKSQGNQGGNYTNDYWVVKTDANGIKQWDKRFGGSLDDQLTSLRQTTDGGYILGGWSASDIGGDKSQASFGAEDFWMVKIDANGNKQWDKDFGGTESDLAYSILQSLDGGYLIGGGSSSEISGSKTQSGWGGGDYWIVKTDSSGIKEWDYRYGGYLREGITLSGENSVGLTSMIQTSDNGFVLGGASFSEISGDKTQWCWGESDFWLVKIDASGMQQWDSRFGGTYSEKLTGFKQTSDGGFIIAGNSTSGASGDKSQNAIEGNDFWIVKTNSGIQPIIALSCDIPTGESTSNITSSSAKTNWSAVAPANKYKVRYRVTGVSMWTKVSTPNNYKKLKNLLPNTQYDWSVKSLCSDLDLGNSDWSATQNFTTHPFKWSEDETLIPMAIGIFPNPFSSTTTLSFSIRQNSPTTIELRDVAGRKIKTLLDENLAEGDHELMVCRTCYGMSLPAGIYFVQLKTDEGVVTRKIVIE